MATDGPPEPLLEKALGAAGTAPPSVGGAGTGPGAGPCGIGGMSPAAGAIGASTGGMGCPFSELPGGGGGMRRRRRRGRPHGRQRIRWHSTGHRAGGKRCALYRREDPIVEVDAIVWRDALRDQIRVERVRSGGVLAHGQGLIPLGVVAEFDCGRTFSGMSHARVVARAAHRERGVLRQFAVQPVRRVDGGGVGGVTPLRRRQEADGAPWRITDGEREVACRR